MRAIRRTSSHCRRISAREEGFTITEVVTVAALLMVVAVSLMAVLQVVERASVRQEARSQAMDQLRVAMERMTRDIRQTTDVRSATASLLDIDTIVNGADTRVTYDASSGDSVELRVDATTLTIVERLRTNAIFTYYPDSDDPSIVQIDLSVDPERFSTDNDPIELRSEVELRNRR